MALGGKGLDIIFDLYQRDFFKNIKSVMDMGDQDMFITFDEIKKKFKENNIHFEEKNWEYAKKFPTRPRVSTSVFWNALGIKSASRLDIRPSSDRDKNDNSNLIIHDLNYPFEKKELFGKYDLVTDIGNNEHPFNIVEAYRTMHNLCSKNGYMIIYQAYLKGNGFYQFDDSTIDNVAAVNNYSIIHSCFVINQDKKSFTLPLDESYLQLINLNNLSLIGIFYVLKKNSDEEFKLPYQGTGKSPIVKEFYTLNTTYKNKLPENSYIPHSIDKIKTNVLIKQIFKRIINKFKK